MSRKIAVVVPVMRNFLGFVELMESIKVPVLPVVVPNFRQNIGVSAGWNKGLKQAFAAGATHALVCNDDVILGSRVISRCADELDNNPDVILATGCNIRGSIGNREPTHEIIDSLGSESVSDGPDYSCFMITPKTIEIVGWFDENFSLIGKAYFEDSDSHYRIKLAGKRGVACGLATMLHRGSRTQNHSPSSPVVTGAMFEANREYLFRKWGAREGGKEVYKTPYNDPSLTYKDWVVGR